MITQVSTKRKRNGGNTNYKTPKNNDEQRNMPLGIVFFSRIEKLKFLSKLLEKEGVASVKLHSQLSTQLRQTNLQRFSCGQCPLLLATDVAARGIDIPLVQFVIQYDFPGNLQQYVHRCGRAGRSGDAATIYSFFTRNLKAMAADLIQLLEANKAWVDPNLRELVLCNTAEKKKTNQNKPAKPLKPKQLPLKAKQEKLRHKRLDHTQELEGEIYRLKRLQEEHQEESINWKIQLKNLTSQHERELAEREQQLAEANVSLQTQTESLKEEIEKLETYRSSEINDLQILSAQPKAQHNK